MANVQEPLLGLRMRAARPCPPRLEASDNDDLVATVSVLLQQESSKSYRCRDYIRRGDQDNDSTQQIDTLCREKMVDWMYRIIDHFHTPREICEYATSFLDRFVDSCSCDRAAFKLAAMTCLYMATKLFNSKEIGMTSLAELSRGEFEMGHIAEMEAIILQSLSWRLHPPTVQCFINHFQVLLPFVKGPVTRAIHQRAAFFAELAVFDYSFVTQPKSLIAVAAILNAMEGMDETVASLDDQTVFVQALCASFQLEHGHEAIEATRNRLWYIYSQSAQYYEDDVLPAHQQQIEQDLQALIIKKESTDGGELSQSPVSAVSLVVVDRY